MATRNRRRPSKQQTALAQVDRFAWLLDNSIRIPGLNYRIGLDAIIGLIPGLGDVAGMILSSFIVLQAIRMGAPGGVLTRMIFNIGLEAALGLVPGLGDIFDAAFKANVRNALLLRNVLDTTSNSRTPPLLINRWVIVAVVVALLAIIVLFGVAGVLLFRWLWGWTTGLN